jgi:single-strand DNA-binding protein
MYQQFIGIGNLAADVESRTTQSGTTVANFTVCCDHGWGDNKKTEFVRCVAWSKLGDICGQYLQKGSKVMVQGTIETRQWEDSSGNKRYSTELNVRDMKMLDSKGQQSGNTGQQSSYDAPSMADDVPF